MSFAKYETPKNINEAVLTGGALKNRQEIALKSTIPSTMSKTIETGRLDAFKLDWKPGKPNKPHVFWDSDTAKVLEGMAAALSLQKDEALEKEYDRWVDLIVSAQQEDGYLNTHFTVIDQEQRFKNLTECHELYCCGHLIEAAVAGYTLLGKRKLLDCLCRYADYLVSYFGPGKHRGWPGHEEIELALVKLYKVTGKKEYFDLASYFINDRGTQPHFFETVEDKHWDWKNNQTHLPVREQETAEGHAVRDMYLFAGAADVASLAEDEELFAACKKVFENVANKRMYITGGVGSSFQNERFTTDYDLTNGSLMYAESCASIALVLFCQRMANITGEVKYADVLEQALFNGVLSGISISGDKYFYTNYLEVDENHFLYNSGVPVRQEWFSCSCCPTNFARFLTQMQQYVFSYSKDEILLHIPTDSTISHLLENGSMVKLAVKGGYPYNGNIAIEVLEDGDYTLSLRLPSWCRKVAVNINGEDVFSGKGGKYLPMKRDWKKGDVISMVMQMTIDYVHSNEKVVSNSGRIAVRRGPVVYCVESQNASCEVRRFILDENAVSAVAAALPGLPDYAPAICLQGWEEVPASSDELYFVGAPTLKPATAMAIPYALWNNRGKTNMAVWLRVK